MSYFDISTPEKANQLIGECYRSLAKANTNLVAEILKRTDKPFYEWQHYPESDVYDRDSHAQYYYHAHPQHKDRGWKEHGHFHLFLRQKGIPAHLSPATTQKTGDTLCHLGAISMDAFGNPIALFTTNRWVTNETWYPAEAVCELLDRFTVDHAFPAWTTNLWLTAMMRYYQEDFKRLLHERDRMVDDWQQKHPDVDVYEDKNLEVTSLMWLKQPEGNVSSA